MQKIICLLLSLFLLTAFSCSKQKISQKTQSEEEIVKAAVETAESEEAIKIDESIEYESFIEYDVPDYYGILNEDNVKLRKYPNLESEIILKMYENDRIEVLGRSGQKAIINNGEDSWGKINFDFDYSWFKVNFQDNIGWVYGKFVDFYNPDEEKLKNEYAQLKFTRDGTHGSIRDYSEIDPDAYVGDIDVYQPYIVLQELYPYGDSLYIDGFNIYEYNKNICFSDYRFFGKKLIETTAPSAFEFIADGLLFIDIGTAPGVRGLKVWNIGEQKEVFSGAHYGAVSYYNNTVKVVYRIWDINTVDYDKEIISFAKEYMENNDKPKEYGPQYWECVIFCDYNLVTGERKILKAEYHFSQ